MLRLVDGGGNVAPGIVSLRLNHWSGQTATFEVGRVNVIVGPAGAGKTSTLRAIRFAITGDAGIGTSKEALTQIVGANGGGAGLTLGDGFSFDRAIIPSDEGGWTETIDIAGDRARKVNAAKAELVAHFGSDLMPILHPPTLFAMGPEESRSFILGLCARAQSDRLDADIVTAAVVYELLKSHASVGEGALRVGLQGFNVTSEESATLDQLLSIAERALDARQSAAVTEFAALVKKHISGIGVDDAEQISVTLEHVSREQKKRATQHDEAREAVRGLAEKKRTLAALATGSVEEAERSRSEVVAKIAGVNQRLAAQRAANSRCEVIATRSRELQAVIDAGYKALGAPSGTRSLSQIDSDLRVGRNELAEAEAEFSAASKSEASVNEEDMTLRQFKARKTQLEESAKAAGQHVARGVEVLAGIDAEIKDAEDRVSRCVSKSAIDAVRGSVCDRCAAVLDGISDAGPSLVLEGLRARRADAVKAGNEWRQAETRDTRAAVSIAGDIQRRIADLLKESGRVRAARISAAEAERDRLRKAISELETERESVTGAGNRSAAVGADIDAATASLDELKREVEQFRADGLNLSVDSIQAELDQLTADEAAIVDRIKAHAEFAGIDKVYFESDEKAGRLAAEAEIFKAGEAAVAAVRESIADRIARPIVSGISDALEHYGRGITPFIKMSKGASKKSATFRLGWKRAGIVATGDTLSGGERVAYAVAVGYSIAAIKRPRFPIMLIDATESDLAHFGRLARMINAVSGHFANIFVTVHDDRYNSEIEGVSEWNTIRLESTWSDDSEHF